MKSIKNSLVVGFIFYFCLILSASGQENAEKEREIFQNQQRALSLSFYKNNIKSLEDAPMRCFVRKQIVEFVFTKKVKGQYELAKDLAIDCLEDIQKNPKQFISSASVKAEMFSMLRANLPDVAKKLEKKYVEDKKESSIIDLIESTSTENIDGVTQRLLSKIQKGDVPQNINFIIPKIRQKIPQAANLVLGALLNYYESSPITESRVSSLSMLFGDYTNDPIPKEIKIRFLNFLIKIGQIAVTADSNSRLVGVSRWMLKAALPHIQELLPTNYQQASALSLTLESKISDEEKEYVEILKRIKESEDKLAQTIIEAEATEYKLLKSILWRNAAKMALFQKKYKISADSILKFEGNKEEQTKSTIEQFLTRFILSAALKADDFEAAEYVVEKVSSPSGKGFSLIELSSKYVKSWNGTKALDKLNEALRVIDKSENNTTKVRIMLSAARLATKIENADAFEITSSAIKTINKFPSLNPEDKLETESRNKYVASVLMPNANNLNKTFDILAEKDIDFVYPTSQGIQRKDLRLVTEIVIEKHKIYPYKAAEEQKGKK